MRLLILNWKDWHHPAVGGAELILRELGRRLAASGWELTWFTRAFPGAAPEEFEEGIRIVRRGNLLSTYLAAPLFFRELRPKPDLVLDCLNTIAWQAPLWAKRVAVVFYVNQLAQEVLSVHLPLLASHLARLAEPIQLRSYRTVPVLCYAPSTKEDLISFGIPADHISLFPLGVDQSRYKPGRKSPTPLFITVGRLVPMKRHDLAIRAMAEVLRSHPTARLVIIGQGPEEERLRGLIKQLKLEKSILLDTRGGFFPQKHDFKVELMQQAWALIFPSLKEGFGLAVTEAAACGTPTIATNVTGLRDSVQHGKTGLLISRDPTPSELAGAMSWFLEHERERRELSRGALEASRRLSWDRSAAIFADLLERSR